MYILPKNKVFLREVDKEIYIIYNGDFFTLSDKMLLVMKFINGFNSIEDILSMLKTDDINEEEVIELIGSLKEEDIIELSETPSLSESSIFECEIYPTSINIELTYDCNMFCEHCLVDFNYTQKTLTFKEIDNIIMQIKELNINIVTITGGEVLFHEELLIYTIGKLKENNIEYALLTNGYMLDDTIISKLKYHNLRKIQISLDSPVATEHDKIRGVTGSYDQVIRAVRLLKEAAIPEIALSMTISQDNFHQLEKFLALCADLEVMPRMAAIVPIQRGLDSNLMLTPEQLVELYRYTHCTIDNKISATLVPTNSCSIGSSPVIAPNGDVFPCMHMKFDVFKLGNINISTLKQIWDTSSILKELQSYSKEKVPKCSKCWNKYMCSPCLGEIYSQCNSIYAHNKYRCRANQTITKLILEKGDEYTQERANKLLEVY